MAVSNSSNPFGSGQAQQERPAERMCMPPDAPTWTSPHAERLRASLDHLNRVTGQKFLDELVQELGRLLRLKFVYVGEIADGGRQIHSVAASVDGGPGEAFSYMLDGTPCARIMAKEPCIHPAGAYRDYPNAPLMQQLKIECYAGTPLVAAGGKPLGILVAMDVYPRTEEEAQFALTSVALFAARAGAELERLQYESALRQAREQAEMANKAKDAFVAMLSHELRTPLMPAMANISDLCEHGSLPVETRHRLSESLHSLELEAKLIDDLLDLSSILRGQLRVDRMPADLHSIVQRSFDLAHPVIAAANIRTQIALDANTSWTLGDWGRLHQVFWNLIRASVTYARGASLVVRSTNPADDQIIIEFEATAIGLSQEQSDHLFEPFSGGLPTIESDQLGLSLAISRSLIERHGGRIWSTSNAEEHRTTFSVELPTIPTPTDTMALPEAEEEPPAPPKLKILLVEDHGPTRSVLARLLERAGHTVATANSVADAKGKLRDRPDLLISDIGLPDGTGLQVADDARQKWPDVRCIALSGYGSEDDIDRSREAGFHSHLVKPVTSQKLLQAIGRAVQQGA